MSQIKNLEQQLNEAANKMKAIKARYFVAADSLHNIGTMELPKGCKSRKWYAEYLELQDEIASTKEGLNALYR
ncbi:MAG: hypothetical protein Q9M28_02715 [Mariprofundaceae bacterium]|nr:hypothetical protein [Mariprofundaceae bacterium]